MPVMDGVEATRRIRNAYPDVAIVALSSTDGPELRDAFLQAGADSCVDKRDMPGFVAAVRAAERAQHCGLIRVRRASSSSASKERPVQRLNDTDRR